MIGASHSVPLAITYERRGTHEIAFERMGTPSTSEDISVSVSTIQL